MWFELALFLGVVSVLVVVINLTVTGKAPKQQTSIQSFDTEEQKKSTSDKKQKSKSKGKAKSKPKHQKPSKKPKAKKNKAKKKGKPTQEVEEENTSPHETEPFVVPADPTRGKAHGKNKDSKNDNEEHEDHGFAEEQVADGWNVVNHRRHKAKKTKKSDKKETKKDKQNQKKEEPKPVKQETKPVLTDDGESPIPVRPIYSSAEEFWKPKPKAKPKAAPTPAPAPAAAKPKQVQKGKKSKKAAKRVLNPNKMEVTLTSRGWGRAPEAAAVSLDGEFPSLSEAKQYKHKKDKVKKQEEKADISNKDIDQDGLHSQEGSDGEEEETISVEAADTNEDYEEESEEESEEEGLPQISFSLGAEFGSDSEVKIVGSLPQLGSWDINHAPSMEHNKGSWTLALPIDTQNFEYKYVRIDDGEEHWEEGPNRSFKASDETEMEINDQWR